MTARTPFLLVAGSVLVSGAFAQNDECSTAAVLAVGCLLALAFSRWGLNADGRPLAWPWYVPLGATVALVISLVQRGGASTESVDAVADVSGS